MPAPVTTAAGRSAVGADPSRSPHCTVITLYGHLFPSLLSPPLAVLWHLSPHTLSGLPDVHFTRDLQSDDSDSTTQGTRCLCVGLALSCFPREPGTQGNPFPLRRDAPRGTGREPLAAELPVIPGTQVLRYMPLCLIYKLLTPFKHAQGFPKGSLCSHRFLPTSICASALRFKILPTLPSQQLSGHLLQEASGAAVPAPLTPLRASGTPSGM